MGRADVTGTARGPRPPTLGKVQYPRRFEHEDPRVDRSPHPAGHGDGQAGDNPQLAPLLDLHRRQSLTGPRQPFRLLAEKAYSHPSTREHLRHKRITHTIVRDIWRGLVVINVDGNLGSSGRCNTCRFRELHMSLPKDRPPRLGGQFSTRIPG